MSVFTPGREKDLNEFVNAMFGGTFLSSDAPYSASFAKRSAVALARENDRDSRTCFTFVWTSLLGFDLQRLGPARHFARQVALDSLMEMLGAPRGAALTAKPDRALKAKIELFKDIQAAREAAFEFTGKGWYGGKDVPMRLGLGGLQDFTPGVKRPTSALRAMHPGGHRRRPPGRCIRSSRYCGSTRPTYH